MLFSLIAIAGVPEFNVVCQDLPPFSSSVIVTSIVNVVPSVKPAAARSPYIVSLNEYLLGSCWSIVNVIALASDTDLPPSDYFKPEEIKI